MDRLRGLAASFLQIIDQAREEGRPYSILDDRRTRILRLIAGGERVPPDLQWHVQDLIRLIRSGEALDA